MKKFKELLNWVFGAPVVLMLIVAMTYLTIIDLFLMVRGWKFFKKMWMNQFEMLFSDILNLD